jgi:hypothetical protein
MEIYISNLSKNRLLESAIRKTGTNMPQQPISPETLTRVSGAPVADSKNSLTAGPRSPVLLQDYSGIEKMTHFNRAHISERVVHAKTAGSVVRRLGSFEHFFCPARFTVGNYRAGLDGRVRGRLDCGNPTSRVL